MSQVGSLSSDYGLEYIQMSFEPHKRLGRVSRPPFFYVAHFFTSSSWQRQYSIHFDLLFARSFPHQTSSLVLEPTFKCANRITAQLMCPKAAAITTPKVTTVTRQHRCAIVVVVVIIVE